MNGCEIEPLIWLWDYSIINVFSLSNSKPFFNGEKKWKILQHSNSCYDYFLHYQQIQNFNFVRKSLIRSMVLIYNNTKQHETEKKGNLNDFRHPWLKIVRTETLYIFIQQTY